MIPETRKKLIGISGKKGSGKDTVADMIQELTSQSWEIKKFADTLKDMVCLLIGCTREQLEDRDFKEKELGEEWWCYPLSEKNEMGEFEDVLLDYNLYKAPPEYLRKTTPRLILQLLGTEGVRNVIHPNAWVNATMSPYNKDRSNWLITDMRFPNEFMEVCNKDGITLRIERPDIKSDDQHPSETALDNVAFHHTIINDGTIEDLKQKVQDFLELYKII